MVEEITPELSTRFIEIINKTYPKVSEQLNNIVKEHNSSKPKTYSDEHYSATVATRKKCREIKAI